MHGAPVVAWLGTGKTAYFADNISLVDRGRHLLWSAADRTCVIPLIHNTFGGKIFTAVAPWV